MPVHPVSAGSATGTRVLRLGDGHNKCSRGDLGHVTDVLRQTPHHQPPQRLLHLYERSAEPIAPLRDSTARYEIDWPHSISPHPLLDAPPGGIAACRRWTGNCLHDATSSGLQARQATLKSPPGIRTALRTLLSVILRHHVLPRGSPPFYSRLYSVNRSRDVLVALANSQFTTGDPN